MTARRRAPAAVERADTGAAGRAALLALLVALSAGPAVATPQRVEETRSAAPTAPVDIHGLPGSPAPDSVEARRLWLAAVDRRHALAGDSAARLLVAAVSADPSFLPAHGEILAGLVYLTPPQRDSVRRLIERANGPRRACLRALHGAPLGYRLAAFDTLAALERRHGPGPCTDAFLSHLVLTGPIAPDRVWIPATTDRLERAVAAMPEFFPVWIWYVDALERLGRRSEATRILDRALTQVPPPDRAALYARRAVSLAAAGDTAQALGLLSALDVAIARHGTAGLLWFRPAPDGPPPGLSGAEPELRARLRLALEHDDPGRTIRARTALGWLLVNSGRAAEGIAHFDALVRLGAELQDPGVRLPALLGRGRALSKAGRLDEAERDLLEVADKARRAGDLHHLAEAHHNLIHVYEGTSRFDRALAASDSFVEAAAALKSPQPRIMSHRDAGALRLRMGWHAAANARFDRMAAVVDRVERNHYWAGEQYERSGRLEDALGYYRRGIDADPFERALNLTGMARIYSALGRSDSAEWAARRHDADTPDQTSVPLLPRILAEQGRTEEAVARAREWVRRRQSGGSIHSQVLARLELAALLLEAGRPGEARLEAGAARRAAGRANLDAERVRAVELEGTARVALGQVERGLTLLREAADETRLHPTPDAVRRTQLALGRALERVGRHAEALMAFDAAARAVEYVSGGLRDDVNRTGYRVRHLEPFDAAVHLLLRAPGPDGDVDALLAWSQRRKDAALVVRGEGGGVDRGSPPAVRGLRKTVGSAALVDYIVTDSVAVAVVVTRAGAGVVPLRASPDSLRALARRIRRPFAQYAGAVDMARADYDLTAAHALYRSVFQPLEPRLEGVERIVIAPDGPLHRVPFDALVTRPGHSRTDYASAAYLLDRYTTSLIPSLRFAGNREAYRAVAGEGPLRVIAVSRGAPGGEREVAAVRTAWGDHRTLTLIAGAATETAVRRHARHARILHVASHAEADDRDPLASHLRLEADSLHDGYLHLAEIAELNAPARIVLLTGCETFEGPLYPGAGIMGLARAFLLNGAEDVVATRWAVPAAATPLVAELHRRLARGSDPASALAAARRAMRREPATAHPFLWASFVLVGRGN